MLLSRPASKAFDHSRRALCGRRRARHAAGLAPHRARALLAPRMPKPAALRDAEEAQGQVAGEPRPAASENPKRTLKHWTAWLDAPFPRLSIAPWAMTKPVRSSSA